MPIDLIHRPADAPNALPPVLFVPGAFAAADATTPRPPVLFVPGAFAGAWMWESTFLPFFAARGFDAYAMSFRAHGRQGWPLHSLGLGAFVSDLAYVVDRLPAAPVLVGHSLGGLVAYEYARDRQLPAVVMFSAVPPDGTLRSFAKLARLDAVSAVKMAAMSLFPPVRMLGSPPKGVYSDRVPADRARTFTRRLRPESWRVLSEVLVRPRAGVRPLETPLYVVGASGDHLIPACEVRRTARALGAPCRIFEGFSHTPFVEPGWETIADDIAGWVETALESRRAAGRPRKTGRPIGVPA